MQTTEKKTYQRKVINAASEITRRTKDVNPYSLVGISAMGFPEKVSLVRAGMASKHVSQRVVLTNPEFPRVYTSAENAFGDRSSFNVRAKNDMELVRVFKKFKDFELSPVAYILRDTVTNKYSCHLYEPAYNLIEKYGFRQFDKIAGKYNEGDIIPKDSVLSQSSSYVDDNYCAGRNIRTAFVSIPELTEDALIIDDIAQKELEYDMVDPITVDIKKDSYLLNMYGDANTYKPFPNIGEHTKDGILCSIRENSYVSSIEEASIPHINDKNIWGDGIVVDIDIFTNVDVADEQFNYYYNQIRNWYSDIYTFISKIVSDPYQDNTSLTDIYNKAEKYLNPSVWCTKEDIVNTVMKFTILQHKEIHEGQKVSGRTGNKSVIAAIVPHEMMPRTDDGRPIHMLSNSFAVPNRIIAFVVYENKVTFMMERLHQHLVKEYTDGNMTQEDVINTSCEFLSIFDPIQGDELSRIYHENPESTFNDILRNGLYLKVEPFNKICMRDALIEAEEKYSDIMKRYKVETLLHYNWINRWTPVDGEYSIGYMYTWVLKQEPTKSMSSVATGKTTLYDLHIKTHRYKDHLINVSANPIRFGEYDIYNLAAGVDIKTLARTSTYYRGSQYTDNSALAAHLNDTGIDTSRYNQFPQIDNLKNILKFLGAKLTPDIYSYKTVGNFDEIETIKFNNVDVEISIADLHYILIMYSHYLQYLESKEGIIADLGEFFEFIKSTNLFDTHTDEYINYIYGRFVDLIPILDQIKQY